MPWAIEMAGNLKEYIINSNSFLEEMMPQWTLSRHPKFSFHYLSIHWTVGVGQSDIVNEQGVEIWDCIQSTWH